MLIFEPKRADLFYSDAKHVYIRLILMMLIYSVSALGVSSRHFNTYERAVDVGVLNSTHRSGPWPQMTSLQQNLESGGDKTFRLRE